MYRLVKEYDEMMKINKVDVNEYSSVATKYSVEEIPIFIIFK